MRIALIWAMDKNRLIGRNNGLPWRLSSDLTHFKQVTMGKPVIMGRKTWDSLGRPLPGRPNIVVSRSEPPAASPAYWCKNIDEAIAVASDWARERNCDELIIMGGAQLYQLAYPMADRLYITNVAAEAVGDTYLPEFDMSGFRCTDSKEYVATERDDYDFCVQQWDKNSV